MTTTENLRERLTYFEQKLKEANIKFAAKESSSSKFSASFTTDKLKTWPDVIAMIRSRIAGIREQLARDLIQTELSSAQDEKRHEV